MGNCCGSSAVDDSSYNKNSAASASASAYSAGGNKAGYSAPRGGGAARDTNVGGGNYQGSGAKVNNGSSGSGTLTSNNQQQQNGPPKGSSPSPSHPSSSSSSCGAGAQLPGGSLSVGRIVKPNLKVFTFEELKTATKSFRPDSYLGEGGFGRVYRGSMDPNTLTPCKAGTGIDVAVKRCSPDGLQGVKEWKTEVQFLGKFQHPNLVKLIGYCMDENELLLVYEFMKKGSLEDHLFSKRMEPPPWGQRMKIAMDAARGLDFLHTSENTVIYRDFKAANVLLDENFTGKLSDFGLARMGPSNGKSHVTTQAVGTYGYAAPEYIATGHLYVKSDVYGFGVVLLEMLTGLRAYDTTRPTGQHMLVEWYKPILHDRGKTKKFIDPRMNGEYPPEGVFKLAQLILRCLENDPRNRPSMSDVLVILERISTIRMQQRPRSGSGGRGGGRKAHSNHGSPMRHVDDGSPMRLQGQIGNTGPIPRPRRDTGPLRA